MIISLASWRLTRRPSGHGTNTSVESITHEQINYWEKHENAPTHTILYRILTVSTEKIINMSNHINLQQYTHYIHIHQQYIPNNANQNYLSHFKILPSVLWRCWLGGRKGIRPVKNWVMGCWHGYLSGVRCRLAYSPADATATHCLDSVKSRLVLPFWYQLTQVVPEKGPLHGCVCVQNLYFVLILNCNS